MKFTAQCLRGVQFRSGGAAVGMSKCSGFMTNVVGSIPFLSACVFEHLEWTMKIKSFSTSFPK